jgi:tripartite-type tricarboxylate transporter receptor subunit TctC
MAQSHTPRRTTSRRALLAGLAATAVTSSSARANGRLPADVRLILGGNLGSTHDIFARAIAAGLESGGHVRKVAIDTISRAGGKLAARTLAEAPPDGATIALLPTGLLYSELLGEPGVAYALARLRWIGSVDVETRMLVVTRRLGITDITALRAQREPIVAATGSSVSQSHYETVLLNRLLRIRLKSVAGFGGPLRFLALANGEVGATILSFESGHAMLRAGELVPLVRLGEAPMPAVLGDAPRLTDLVATDDRPLAELVEAHSAFGRWFCLPPGTKQPMVDAWRAAFDAVARGAEFRSRAVTATGLARGSPDVTSGATIEAALQRIKANETALRAALVAALKCGETIAVHGPDAC